MKKLFIAACLMLVGMIALSQNYNNFVLSTNVLPVLSTNSVVSSNLYCISRNGTLWVSLQPITNNPSVTAGTGQFVVTLGGSQYTGVGPITNVNYWGTGGTNSITVVYSSIPYTAIATNTTTTLANTVTVVYNGTNPVTGYLNFDASPFGSLELLNMQNQSTNLIATNITANITWH